MGKTLPSFVTKALFIAAFALFSQNTFAQIFNFMFENTTAVTTENAVGTPTFINAVETSTFSTGSPCQGSRMLIQDNWESNDYLQFTVNTTGYGNMSMSFCNRADNTGLGTFLVQVSSDLGATWTTVLSSFTPTTSNNTLTTGTFPASANNQPEVRIQILKISNPSNMRDYFLDNVTLSGTAGAYPTVTGVAATGCVGSAVNITGTNFTGTTGVQINGVNVASFVVNSATSITAIVASGNTSGVVKVTNAVGSGSSVGSVTINQAPTGVTATPSAASVCLGGTINLTASATSNSSLNATLINENFNTANSWVKTNTSTSGTPANAAWTQRADGYSYTDTNGAANVWHSNDNSQFYLTNSDAQGTGSTTATTLAVPAFSTVGLASASLSYYQHYRTYAGQTALVEISNNGTAWTTLVATPGATVGSITGFVQNTVAIPAGNLEQATVYIRFRFNSPFGWWWAIDNVNVSGVFTTAPAPTYAWTSVPAGFTSSLQNPTNVAPTVNTVYTVTATNSYGCTTSASTVSVTIDPAAVGGTVTTSTTVCSGANSGTLFLNGQTGNVVRWESSSDDFATAGTPIANTTTSLVYTNLTATTSFRAVVQSGACTAANSVSATVTVNPVSVGGTVGNSVTVCSGANSGSLLVSGHIGTIVRWESSLDEFATAGTPIAVTNTSLNYSNLTATTSYRAVVQSGLCAAAHSDYATITVNPATVAGTVTGSATVCSGNNSGTLNLGIHTGNIIRWESSLDNFATAGTPIANTTTSLNYSNLTATTAYRAVVQSGVCASANSVAATITVNPASVGGTVNGSTTVCATSNSGTLTLSGHVGTIIKWQSSDLSDFSAGVLDIPNTSTTLSFVNISATTYYRAAVASGVCVFAYSSVAEVTVDAAATGGSVSGNATVCYGNNGGSLALSGNSGAIIRWESSLNNFATAGVPIANTTATQNYSNLTNTTYYRAVINGGGCGDAYASVAVITVDNNTIWIGANGSAWNDAANWSCGAVPTSDVNVTITSVMNEPVVSTDAYAKTLTMDPGTTLTVQSGNDLRIVNAITGLGNALLTIESNANLIQELDVDNAGSAVVKRTSNPLMRLDYILWSSPVKGTQTLLNFSPATTANRFYIYNPSTDLYNSIAPSAATFSEGTGYLIRMPNNHPTTPTLWNGQFTGTLNNGDVNISVTNGTYNAIGNPYPSTIDADMFIAENNITEALYFWRKTNNDLTTSYATYTLAGGVGTSVNAGGDPNGLVPNGIIQVGQGFIAKSTSANFNFNNGMRLGNNGNQFFRASEVERNRIWLNLTNAEGVFSQTMVSYMTGATYGIDAAIDGPYFNDSQLALTSIINNNEYAVQGRSLPFDNTDTVALGFKAIAAGNYTIGIDHADGLFADVSQDVFLKDNLDGSIHDLRDGNYTFASEAGVFNSRFEIIYLNNILAVNNPVWDASQVVVYKQGNDLVINSGKQTMAKVKVYDIRGRLLAEKENINASETKMFTDTTNQVLVVKVTSVDNKEVVKKVMN